MQNNIQIFKDALRSGKYEKAHASCFEDGCYCLLGVYAELFAPEEIKAAMYDGDDSTVFRWTRLNGPFKSIDEVWHLNDNSEMSLPELADHIEPLLWDHYCNVEHVQH